ncbi:hypothetical protein D3C77_181770 [compost metagenome]
MALLDFSEIPPSKAPSSDVSAFEKFAKDFFLTIFNAEIERTVGRGADGGADIVIRVGSERWLVSCKNYSKAIPRHAENSPLGDMQQWGCQKFIGFYVPEPSTGLVDKLRQTEASNPSFKHQVFDNKDIERNLIASASPAGWLLAFRWFPKSFSKIASSLVLPFTEYSKKDVIREHGTSRINGISTYITYDEDSFDAAEMATNDLVSIANEIATEKVFPSIFMERIKDFCLAVPGSFLRPSFISDIDTTPRNLFPSWDLNLVRKLSSKNNKLGLISLCRIWSIWNIDIAQAVYYYGRNIIGKHSNYRIETETTDIQQLREIVREHIKNSEYGIKDKYFREEFSFSEIARKGQTAERGYFASLLCFRPVGLTPFIAREYALFELSIKFSEENILINNLKTIIATFDPHDREYVEAKSPNLHELLISVNYIDYNYVEKLKNLNPNLKCISEPLIEFWRPDGTVNALISEALGFQAED